MIANEMEFQVECRYVEKVLRLGLEPNVQGRKRMVHNNARSLICFPRQKLGWG